MSVLISPLSEKESKFDDVSCLSCHKRSKYMFTIISNDGDFGADIEGEYCYRCIAKEYAKFFPQRKGE